MGLGKAIEPPAPWSVSALVELEDLKTFILTGTSNQNIRIAVYGTSQVALPEAETSQSTPGREPGVTPVLRAGFGAFPGAVPGAP